MSRQVETPGEPLAPLSPTSRSRMMLRLPRNRPRALSTTRTSCGCYMYRPRTTFAAIVMLTLGTVFLTLGMLSVLSDSVETGGRGYSLLILGGLLFLPGSYASYILLGIHMRWDNFDGTMLPSYDDDEDDNDSTI